MRLTDVDRLLSEPMKNKYYHLKNGDTAVPLIDIKNAPIVDAIPVVYCKDCIHWDERKGEKYCEEMYFNQDDPKFYCGYAERRENAVD